MANPASAPKLVSAALVVIPQQGSTKTIEFTINPDAMHRTLTPRLVGGEQDERSLAVRYTGAPRENITITVLLDATDKLNKGDPNAIAYGILPDLETLELLVFPSTTQVKQNIEKLQQGQLEIAPNLAPLILFTWGKNRTWPVILESYTLSEELFDGKLNPIRAYLTLSMRVLTYTDLAPGTTGYNDYLRHLATMRRIAGKFGQKGG